MKWVLGPGAVSAGRDIRGPVTVTTLHGSFDRLADAVFNPEPLRDVLDLANFTGREWIIGQIDNYIATRPRGYVVIQAEAGVGKSALAAHLAFTRPCVHHFTRLEGARSPEQARRSLAAQLIGQWQLYDLAPGDTLPAGTARPDWLPNVIRAAIARRDAAGLTDPLVLVVDGLDEADPPTAGQDTGIPLGLPRPEHLPRGAYIVVTTRFGLPLPAVRGPVDWTTITVDGADNLSDMRRFLHKAVTEPVLARRLAEHDVDRRWFIDRAAAQCHGVWMYLRYVLDDIRERRRDPTTLDGLPEDLSGYYLEQIHRWRTTRDTWPTVGLRLFATLAALRRPAGRAELATFAGVDRSTAEPWLEGDLRPFLEQTHDSHRLHAIRHQSLRDLFQPAAPDGREAGTRETLHDALLEAHSRIAKALIPPGPVDQRDWSTVDTYTRAELPEHAAESGHLDELACDPGFLLACDPPALLRRSSCVTTGQARAALAACEFTVDSWPTQPDDGHRLWWLHVWARKTRGTLLADRAAARTHHPWTITKALWNGITHRILSDAGRTRALCAVPLPDGRTLLATGGHDKLVRLWDPVTGTLVGAPLTGHTGMVCAACAVRLPDGRTLLATAGADKTVRLWDPLTGDAIGAPLTGHTDRVEAICAVPTVDGRTLLATAGVDRTIRLWDPLTGDAVGTPLTGHTHGVQAICALPMPGGRTLLISVGIDNAVRLWDPVRGEAVRNPRIGHGAEVNVAVELPLPGGHSLVATAGNDGMVRLWEPVSGATVGTPLSGHRGQVVAICALPMPGGRALLASAAFDEAMRVWDPIAGQIVGKPLTGHTEWVSALCAVPLADGRTLLASAAEDETVRLWDPGTDRSVGDSLTGPDNWVLAMCTVPFPDGRTLLATGGFDNTIRLWDPVTGRAEGEPFVGHTGWVRAMCTLALPDGRTLLATSGYDDTIRLWDPVSGTPVGEPMANDPDAVRAMCAVPLPDGRTLLAVPTGHRGESTRVRLWDPVTGNNVGEPIICGELRTVCAVRLPDGRTLLATGHSSAVRLWDPLSGKAVGARLVGHTNAVLTACALPLPGGRTLLATGGHDNAVRLWDPSSGDAAGAPLTGHTSTVDAMCALPSSDGRTLLVTGGYDRTVRLWDPESGAAIGEPLVGHDGAVNAMCALPMPGGRTLLATTGDDRAVLIWEWWRRSG